MVLRLFFLFVFLTLVVGQINYALSNDYLLTGFTGAPDLTGGGTFKYSGYLTLPSLTFGNTGKLTVAFDLALLPIQVDSYDCPLLYFSDPDDETKLFGVLINHKAKSLVFTVVLNGGTAELDSNRNFLHQLGASYSFNSVAITAENNAGSVSIKLYINGDFVAGRTIDGLIKAGRRTDNTLWKSPDALHVRVPPNSGITGLAAFLDNFGLYDVALTPDDISYLSKYDYAIKEQRFKDKSIYLLDFEENDRGLQAWGYIGPNSAEGNSISMINLHNDAISSAAFVAVNRLNLNLQYRTCVSSGDPHYYNYTYTNGKSTGSVTYTDGQPHSLGLKSHLTCVRNGDPKDVIFQAFSDHVSCGAGNVACNGDMYGYYNNNGGRIYVKVSRNRKFFYSRDGENYLSLEVPAQMSWHDKDTGTSIVWTGVGSGTFYAPPYGSIYFDSSGGFMRTAIYLPICDTRGSGYCDGKPTPYAPPDEPPPPDVPPPPIDPDECDEEKKAQAEGWCAKVILDPADFNQFGEWAKLFETIFDDCVLDRCNDADVPTNCDGVIDILFDIINSEKSTEDQKEKARALYGERLSRCNCEDCDIEFGECVDGECKCKDGYFGPHCTEPEYYQSVYFTSPSYSTITGKAGKVTLPPYYTPDIDDMDIYKWVSSDSIVFYFASERIQHPDKKARCALVMAVKASSAAITGSISILTDGKKSGTEQIEARRGETNARIIYDFVLGEAEEKIVFTGLNLKEGDLIPQVLFGSGLGLSKGGSDTLDLLRIPNEDIKESNELSVYTKIEKNVCGSIRDCSKCVENEKCGFCRGGNFFSDTCKPGFASGPTDGTTCVTWAFTLEPAVSRRITLRRLGFPVIEQETLVILSGDDQLPIEFRVAQNTLVASNDVLIVLPDYRGLPFISSFKSNIQPVLNAIVDHDSSIGVSSLAVSKYTSPSQDLVDKDAEYDVPLIFPLRYVAKNIDNIKYAVDRGLVATSANDLKELDYCALIREVRNPSWRVGARHVMIIEMAGLGTCKDAPKAALGDAVIPIFLTHSGATLSSAREIIKKLGYGFSITIDPLGVNIASAISRSLYMMNGAISSVLNGDSKGRIDEVPYNTVFEKSIYQLEDLKKNSRARFIYPYKLGSKEYDPSLKGETTEFIVPGFGTASVVNYKTEKPIAISATKVLKQGELDSDNVLNIPIHGAILSLSGVSNGILGTTESITAYINSYNTDKGVLYQFVQDRLIEGGDLSDISINPSPGNPVAVTDPMNRVFYSTEENVYNDGADSYDTVSFHVRDKCDKSDDATYTLSIEYKNKKPNAYAVTATGTENRPLVVNLGGFDNNRGHDLNVILDEYSPEHTLPGHDLLPVPVSMRVFKYSTECWDSVKNLVVGEESHKDEYDGCKLAAKNTILGVINHSESLDLNNSVKVIVIPSVYANSEGVPYQYKLDGKIKYHLKQLDKGGSDEQLLTSEVATVSTIFNPVNQPPIAGPDGPSTWLSWPTSPIFKLPFCGHDCVVLQNLGMPWPNTVEGLTSPVYMGANDVEGDEVRYEVTKAECIGTTRILDAETRQPVVIGEILDTVHPSNGYVAALLYSPGQDDVSSRGKSEGCVISYKAHDANDLSIVSNEYTFKIIIAPSILGPRSSDSSVVLTSPGSVDFELKAKIMNDGLVSKFFFQLIPQGDNRDATWDVNIEGKNFRNTSEEIIGTYGGVDGFVELRCGDYLCMNNEGDEPSFEITCNQTDDVVTFRGTWTVDDELFESMNQPWQEVALLDFVISNQYYRPKISYDQIQNSIDWGDETCDTAESNGNKLHMYYYNVNEPPTIIRGGEVITDGNIDMKVNEKVSLGLSISDPDVNQGLVSVHVVFTSDFSQLSYTNSFDSNTVLSLETSSDAGVTTLDFSGNLVTVNAFLDSFVIVSGDESGIADFTIDVNDNGNTGACSEVELNPCHKTARANIRIKISKTSSVVAIAAGVSAAVAAVAAAAGAAALWRFLRKPPSDEVDPWSAENEEGFENSPIHEPNVGASGSNPTYS